MGMGSGNQILIVDPSPSFSFVPPILHHSLDSCMLVFQKRFDSKSYTASEIFFDVHLTLDKLDNEYEMSGKSLDES